MSDTVNIGGYTIKLVSAICDGVNQTFTYNVSFTTPPPPYPSPAISNFAFALCTTIIHKVIATSSTGEANTDLMPCFATPTPPVVAPPQQVKFDATGGNDFINPTTGTDVFFTLQGCFVVADIDIALHADNICSYDKISGPTCDPIPTPPGRGIHFSELNK